MKNPIFTLYGLTWKYAKGKRDVLVIFVTMFVISNGVELVEPLIIGDIFNLIQSAKRFDEVLLAQIMLRLGLLLAIPFIFWLFHGNARVLERKNSFFIMSNYKQALLDKVINLPIAWHRDHHSGKTISKINRASRALFDFSSNIFEDLHMGIKLIGSFVLLMYLSFYSGLVTVGISVLAIIVVILFDKKLTRLYDKIYRAENYVAAAIHDYLTNIGTIITMRLTGRAMKDVSARIDAYSSDFKRSVILNEVKWAIISFIVALMTIGILALHIYEVIRSGNALLVGTLYTLFAYLQNVGTSFYMMAWKYSTHVEQAASVNSARDLIQDADSNQRIRNYTMPPNWQEIVLRDLSFTYVDEKKKRHHLENVNMRIGRGQKIALIGPSGCGKSTTLALLRGLFPVKSGQLEVDGKIMPHVLAHMFGYVTLIPQEPEIFENSIGYNLTLGARVSAADLKSVLAISRFDEVLKRIPKGVNANIVEKGVNLSGGEKQRLALARGLIAAKDSNFLFLDEPTSSVDPRNELKIYEKLFAVYHKKTVISALHRLHLLKLFDYIYLFDEGKVIEEGTLAELLERGETFQKMWTVYFKTHKTPLKSPQLG